MLEDTGGKWPKKGYTLIFDQSEEDHMARYAHVFEIAQQNHSKLKKTTGMHTEHDDDDDDE